MKLPCPQTSVQQGAQRRWAPLLVGTNRSYMGWEEQKGHLRCRTDGVWCCTGSGKWRFFPLRLCKGQCCGWLVVQTLFDWDGF